MKNGFALLVIISIIIIVSIIFFMFGGKKESPAQQISDTGADENAASQATIETDRGNIVIELYGNDAPKTVVNFTKLAREGFYNGTKFHRVISGFMIQGGDPLTKDDSQAALWGTGGPGYKFDDELNPATKSYQEEYERGVVAMANSGPNTNGSQFFIMHKDTPLPHAYTIFGKVISGIEVVDSIASSPTDQNDRPKAPIAIKSIQVQ